MNLFIAGQLGSGKTCFCKWLVSNHGFVHVQTDEEPRWIDIAIGPDPGPTLRNELGHLGPDVAFEWGFAPEVVQHAGEVIRSGCLEHWWFAGDISRARYWFAQRKPPVSLAAFDVQTAGIKAIWPSSQELFLGRIIDMLGPNDERPDPEVVFARMIARE